MTKVVTIQPIKEMLAKLTIQGTSPMMQHNWSEKAKKMMRDKHQGKKTKNREVRDVHQEFLDAHYRTEDGGYGIPVKAVKKCVISAAHKDLGIEKTLVAKAFFVRCNDANGVIPIQADDPIMDEDVVRVGMGSTDLRYRPRFASWRCDLEIEFDGDLLTEEDIINLVNRAGFGVGIGESRPEKKGDLGRFEVDREVEYVVQAA